LPCATGPANSTAEVGYTVSAITIAQPFSMSFVGQSFTFSTPSRAFIDADNGTTTFNGLLTAAANAWEASGISTAITGTASDNALHAANAVFNSSSSVLNIDGTETTGNPGTISIASTDTVHFLSDGFDDTLFGLGNEGGILPSGMSSTVRTNLCHNQFEYWGTATSC
jgi:hypothetical protein